MAKAKIDSSLIAEVKGPAGGLDWLTTREGTSLIRAQATRPGPFHRKDPRAKTPWLISPDTYDADCKAWKAADAHYAKIETSAKNQWRNLRSRPPRSAYDGYMKQAIPHLLRGYPAPDQPLPTTRFKVHNLHVSRGYMHNATLPFFTCRPPEQCKTAGLHWLKVEQATAEQWIGNYHWHGFAVRVAIDADTGARDHNKEGYITVFTYPNPSKTGQIQITEKMLIKTPSAEIYLCISIPVWVGVLWEPLDVDEDGFIIKPYRPSPVWSCFAYYLTKKYEFFHWPRNWPSRKKDHQQPPPPYPQWPVVQGEPTYYPW